MRKMATVRRIDAINPIPNADAIECATVGGWRVVVKKGEFAAGDLAVYAEVDSWIPHELAPFLTKGNEPREYNGVKGERLRTVRLRGQVSQGLLLSGTPCPTGLMVKQINSVMQHIFQEGNDVSEWLGIQKWEAPVPAQLAGEVRGMFPGYIPKTDQERIQNLVEELADWTTQNLTWEVTEKLDGSSMTVYFKDGDFGVCSRNLNLRETEGNTFWRVARELDLERILRNTNKNLALQGELIGEGIQGNPYRLKGQRFVLFDIYDITDGAYVNPVSRQAFAEIHEIPHVPVLRTEVSYSQTVESILVAAEGKSQLNKDTEREGLVFKCEQNPDIHFKAISNRFLLKTGG